MSFFLCQYYCAMLCEMGISTLYQTTTIHWSKLTVFVDNIIKACLKEFVCDRQENVMGKEKNAGYHNVFKNLVESWVHDCIW